MHSIQPHGIDPIIPLKNTKYQTTKIHSLWHHGCPTWSRDKVMNWGKNTTFTFINFSYLKVRQMIGMLSYDDDDVKLTRVSFSRKSREEMTHIFLS